MGQGGGGEGEEREALIFVSAGPPPSPDSHFFGGGGSPFKSQSHFFPNLRLILILTSHFLRQVVFNGGREGRSLGQFQVRSDNPGDNPGDNPNPAFL